MLGTQSDFLYLKMILNDQIRFSMYFYHHSGHKIKCTILSENVFTFTQINTHYYVTFNRKQ